MNKKGASDVIKKIAKREGVKESDIRKEMEKAILIGFLNPETRYKWSEIFGAGKLPSPEEFIMIMNEKIIKL